MRKIRRLSLPSHADRLLKDRTRKVNDAPDPEAAARRLWRQRRNRAFRSIRATLERMAPGIQHCMYCENNEATDIEHFWPRSLYPLRTFEWTNYLLACSNCNSNHKRAQFPLDDRGLPQLLDPTIDEPLEHLELLPLSGSYRSLSEKGGQSIRVFGLERETLRRSRRNAWIGLQELIVRYVSCKTRGEWTRASDIHRTISEYPFASVLDRLLHLSTHPAANLLVSQDCLEALKECQELRYDESSGQSHPGRT